MKLAKILGAAAFLVSFAAEAVTITFDDIASTTLSTRASYSSDGFVILWSGNVGITPGQEFGSWGSTGPSYAGSAALFNNYASASTQLSKIGGGSFSFDGIDVSELFRFQSGAYRPTSITFIGVLPSFSQVAATVSLDQTFGFQSFTFGPEFDNVIALRWAQCCAFGSGELHQFDNIRVDVAAVPEPSSVVLGLLGLLALVLGRRMRPLTARLGRL